ncbi:MAG: hypothetical protein NVSMB6_05680 [Burkholderiaceae bacterium]
MTECTLVSGGTAADREAAIAACVNPRTLTYVLLEGGHGSEHPLANAVNWPNVRVDTIAAGCPCCNAGMVMRVTVDRILRRRPTQMFISLAQFTQVQHLQKYLSATPYAALVYLSPPISCDFRKVSTRT